LGGDILSELQETIALITGGNSSIGLATAVEFVAEGAYVFITGRRHKELDAAVGLIGRNVTAVQGDVSNLADLDRLYAQVAKEKAESISPLPMRASASLLRLTEQDYDQVFNVNLRGLSFTVQKAVPLMPDGGIVLLCGSNASQAGVPGFTAYSGTKTAIRSFARTWTMELRDRKIPDNVINPGPIDTPFWNSTSLPEEDAEEKKKKIVSMLPANEMGRPEDVAKAASFMASSDARFIRGIELFVNGGMASV
jgi:NAD(P)-dependent dehydrogenase (short-subunit alcohol dehydrogenase family)